MQKSRFTEEQISAILKEWETRGDSRDLCRRHGISHASLSRWKVKFGRPASGAQEGATLVQEDQQLSQSVQEDQQRVLRGKSAGRKLRQLREELGLSFTQVRKETEWIARRFHNRDLVVWHGSLSNIEAGTHIPTIYQLYALSLTYRRSVSDLLSFYGLG